jgi:hypothetical protein
LAPADPGHGERVLIGGLAGLHVRGPDERGLGVLEEVHLEADAAEPQEDLRIVRGELLRAHPIREGTLQLPWRSATTTACRSAISEPGLRPAPRRASSARVTPVTT